MGKLVNFDRIIMKMEENLESLLKYYTSLKYSEDNKKIICEWSGHEMPLNIDYIKTYLNGNRYKKLLAKNINQTDLKKYKEFLVTSTKPWAGNMLFCLLTLKHVNKQPDHIQKHITGKRFLKGHEYWLECKEKGIKFVPICKQRFIAEEHNDDHEASGESETDEMFDMMEMEEDIESISNEPDLKEDEIKSRSDVKISNIESENSESNISSDVEPRSKPVKRKLDSKLNKKLKIEPRKKKITQ